jgi:hypothetical protein
MRLSGGDEMAKRAVRAFDERLEKLFRDRTHWLRREVQKPRSGPPPKFNRKKVQRAITALNNLATKCLRGKYQGAEYVNLYDKKKQWQVNRNKGWGSEKKRKAFDKWFEKFVPHLNCVYVFWSGRICRYVGRTLNGKGRPQSHFQKAWFVGVTRIDILSSKNGRNIAQLECLTTHRFNPKYSKIKPSAKKWYAKCPVCETHKRIRNEVKSIFRLR